MAMFDVQYEVNERAIEFLSSGMTSAVLDAVERAIAVLVIEMANYAKDKAYPDSGLHVRSGALRRSIVPQPVERSGRNIIGRVIAGQNLPYAALQEFGGTILPRNAQYLTIPVGEALTESGVARFSARQAEAAGYKTFVRHGMIYGKKQDGSIVPLFILKRSVTVPARPYMRPTLAFFKDKIVRDISRAINDGARQIPKG